MGLLARLYGECPSSRSRRPSPLLPQPRLYEATIFQEDGSEKSEQVNEAVNLVAVRVWQAFRQPVVTSSRVICS